jgi:hypothetical protein
MGFKSGIAVDSIPKRVNAGRPANLDGAKALLALISKPGSTATDGEVYEDATKARAKAGAAKRLVGLVAPADQTIKTRAFNDAKGWHWVIFLAPKEDAAETPAETPAE